MPRLLFEKTGNAIWISHLDLMRVFQRAFKRSGFNLKHSQGYNPRPLVSIALPLSVGVESYCELLDFELDGVGITNEELLERLNYNLIAGVHVLSVYDSGMKIRDLAFLSARIVLEYDNGVPCEAATKIKELFSRTSLIVQKKTKSGLQDQDIIPMIQSLDIARGEEKELLLDCVICCQNPTLNPAQIVSAIATYLPELKPDFSKCSRLEIYDKNNQVFR